MQNPRPNRLAVVLPSRGLVFSKTVEELYRELDGLDFKIFWSHGRPIPDCFEVPTQEALKDKSFTHLLTIEEDMIIPKGAIKKMLSKRKEAVAYDYPVTERGDGAVMYAGDKALWSGCGILLVEMDIVRRMVFPIWRSDIAWDIKSGNTFVPRIDQRKSYGRQDISFGLRLYINDLPIYIIGDTGQRKLVASGVLRTNDGSHTVVEWTDIAYSQKIHKVFFKGLETVENWLKLKGD